MRRALPALAFALLVPACAAPPSGSEGDGALGQTRSAIVNGSVSSSAQDATVMMSQNGQFSCTGTLIAPNLVLTARHCVSQLNENTSDECGEVQSDDPPTSFAVSLGVSATAAGAVAKGTKVYAPTGASLCGNDIALLQLDHDISGAMVAPVRFTALTVNELTTAVGYGELGNGQTPTQRMQRSGIAVGMVGPSTDKWQTDQGQILPISIVAGEIATGEATCFGDSGGPLFDQSNNIVGVTSRGLDQACIDRPTIFTAITTHEQLIRDALSAAGHPVATAASSASSSTATATPSTTTTTAATTSAGDTTPAMQSNACAAAGTGAGGSSLAGVLVGVVALLGGRRRRHG